MDQIKEAFAGVRLGNGIGLEEAQAIDDYADPETRAARRLKDEKDDWHLLTAEALNRCHSSLSFFDAEGMRFHLPAFLCAELRGEFRFGLASSLTQRADFSAFDLLTPLQREAVRTWLKGVDDEWERPHIERALEGYWADA